MKTFLQLMVLSRSYLLLSNHFDMIFKNTHFIHINISIGYVKLSNPLKTNTRFIPPIITISCAGIGTLIHSASGMNYLVGEIQSNISCLLVPGGIFCLFCFVFHKSIHWLVGKIS